MLKHFKRVTVGSLILFSALTLLVAIDAFNHNMWKFMIMHSILLILNLVMIVFILRFKIIK